MKRIVTTTILSTLFTLAAHAQAIIPYGPASQPGILLGAYAPAAVDAPEVTDAKNFAQSRIPSLTLVDVNVAYTQVVSGCNVKLIATGVEDGRQVTWKFVIYKNLDGLMSLTLAERL